MKSIFVTIILSLFVTTLSAQEAVLTGKILDTNKAPIELVYVSLLKTDSTPFKKALTDSLGRFNINAEKGRYLLMFEEFGAGNSREISLFQDTDLGELVIKETQELEGVTVTGRKKIIEQQVDRLVFYVENATSVSGGTALDALKATPTVKVQNDQVSIAGKGEVLVMVDDRLQRMSAEDLSNFLKTIPADNIKSIEVITTPPAKYDAEGNTGLINIKLKKGRVNSWNADLGTSFTQRTYAGGTLQGLFNYNRNKLSFQFSVNKGQQQLLTTLEEKIYYPQELWEQQLKNRTKSGWVSLNAGIDYKLTKRWTSGIRYLGSFTNSMSGNNPLTTRFDRTTELVNSYIISEVSNGSKNRMNSLNWNHAFALDSAGKTISVDLDYFEYNKKDERSFSGNESDASQNTVPDSYFSASATNLNQIRNYSVKTDVSLPLKGVNITFGAKFAQTQTNNDLVVYDRQSGEAVLDSNQSNVFNYLENSESVYVSGSKRLNEKWEAQIGLRAEATQTTGYSKNLDQTNKNNYVRLFPTAYLTYTANDKNSFSLNYSRRIRRPNFDYLNPFIIRTNPYSYSEGNPFLKPSYSDNLELSYVQNQKWVSSVYYSQVSDFGQELAIVDRVTQVTRQTPLNYANTYQIGFSTYYNFSKVSWWNSFTGFNVNYQHIRSKTAFIQSTDGFNGYCYTNNDFTLNKKKTIFLGLNYALQLPGRYQVFHLSTMHMLDVSAKFLMLDKKLSLTLVCEDVLNQQRPLITYTSNGIENTIRSYGDTRSFRVSLSYKFGNKHIQSKERDGGNEDEKERAN